MSHILTVKLSKPIISAKILDDYVESDSNQKSSREAEVSESQKIEFLQATKSFNGAVARLNEFYDSLLVEQSEEIARLSVEIARKILMKKVEDGDYEIESIVKEALKSAPSRQDVVVHLHPDDFAQCQKAQQAEPDCALVGVELISDEKIGRAECLIESPKGIIKSLINESLERVSKVLENKE